MDLEEARSTGGMDGWGRLNGAARGAGLLGGAVGSAEGARRGGGEGREGGKGVLRVGERGLTLIVRM